MLDGHPHALLVCIDEPQRVVVRDVRDALVGPATLALVRDRGRDLEHDDGVGLDETAHPLSG